MPSRPRSDVFDPTEVGVYHCTSRCVRQRPLCGFDWLTGKDYSHRKRWLIEKSRELQSIFMIDLLAFAILCNHFHTLIRNRPDLVEKASDAEIARRRLLCCPFRRGADGKPCQPTRQEIAQVIAMEGEIDKWRERLSSISWYMKFLKEPISKLANQEDEVEGHFWAERFGATRLLDSLAVLMGTLYIDLNEIRAGLAKTPETSRHSSFFPRVQAWYQYQLEHGRLSDDEAVATEGQPPTLELGKYDLEPAPAWLAPINEESGNQDRTFTLTAEQPIEGGARSSNAGFLPMTLPDYFSMCDWVGRSLREGKRGAIPAHLAKIMDRLTSNLDAFLKGVKEFRSLFRRFSGSPAELAARNPDGPPPRYSGTAFARELYGGS